MKQIFIFLMFFCLLGCAVDPVSSVDPEVFIGTWTGTSSATYPGPDDAPITAEEPIQFVFGDSTFAYYWLSTKSDDPLPYGSGKYTIGDSTLTFTDVLLGGFYEPMDLQGQFEFGFVGNTLSLVQSPAGFFQTYHLVTLEKEELVPVP